MSAAATPMSLNEIGFYFTRAAVGAGAPFGLGEEFAETSRWTAYLGLDPAAAAVPALRGLAAGESGIAMTLRREANRISVESRDGRILSAIYAGPAVADRLLVEAARTGECRLLLDATDQPLLIAAAVASADIRANRIAMSWQSRTGGRIVVELNHGVAALTGLDAAAIAAPDPARVEIVLNGAGSATPSSSQARTVRLADGRSGAVDRGVVMDGAARSTVYDFFSRCLVPSTGRSRTTGAGAGKLTDNC
ncbi:MAG: DUF3726 domain-containing protein [Alphaproteobacteria bacterium]|nr:DUF3726 domain-containing protein [Alphaproteobacteria bacterium]